MGATTTMRFRARERRFAAAPSEARYEHSMGMRITFFNAYTVFRPFALLPLGRRAPNIRIESIGDPLFQNGCRAGMVDKRSLARDRLTFSRDLTQSSIAARTAESVVA